ncbi:MAG: NlpC/P60 family protein [Pseudomonadota bacterium]
MGWGRKSLFAIAVTITLPTQAPSIPSPPSDSLTAMLARTSPNFYGPNCFNTVLLATGVLPFDDVRYVDSDEFEFLLRLDFDLVKGEPRRGDVVLYSASDKRNHAAVYLGEGRVFHKKDWYSAYVYREVGIDEVFSYEPGDDHPRRPEDPIPTWSREEIVDREFYRPKGSLFSYVVPFELRPAEQVLSYVHAAVLEYGPRWKVGDILGIVTEDLMSSIWSRMSEVPALAVLAKSLHNQVYKSIVAEHFASIFADRERIERKIYFKDNEFLRTLIQLVSQMEGVDADLDGVIACLEADRTKRRLSLPEAVREAAGVPGTYH